MNNAVYKLHTPWYLTQPSSEYGVENNETTYTFQVILQKANIIKIF